MAEPEGGQHSLYEKFTQEVAERIFPNCGSLSEFQAHMVARGYVPYAPQSISSTDPVPYVSYSTILDEQVGVSFSTIQAATNRGAILLQLGDDASERVWQQTQALQARLAQLLRLQSDLILFKDYARGSITLSDGHAAGILSRAITSDMISGTFSESPQFHPSVEVVPQTPIRDNPGALQTPQSLPVHPPTDINPALLQVVNHSLWQDSGEITYSEEELREIADQFDDAAENFEEFYPNNVKQQVF